MGGDSRVTLYLHWDSTASRRLSSRSRAATIPHLWRCSIYISDRSMRYISVKLGSRTSGATPASATPSRPSSGWGFVKVALRMAARPRRASLLSHKMRGVDHHNHHNNINNHDSNSIDTVNAAATAIVATEACAQPFAILVHLCRAVPACLLADAYVSQVWDLIWVLRIFLFDFELEVGVGGGVET
ncbi:hypothetical protein NL676_039336 [Syzygium grande]|nr:hypothetical protein NL676_039336 [Syzygium grande]